MADEMQVDFGSRVVKNQEAEIIAFLGKVAIRDL